MSTTLRTSAAAVLAAALAAGGVATLAHASTAGASPTSAESTEHLTFFARDTTQTSIDLAPKGESQGDLLVFHGLKYDKKGGKVVGRYGGTCTTFAKAKGISADTTCTIDIILAGGHLYIEGIGTTTDLFNGKKFTFGVTGGTGKYRGARGEGSFVVDVKHPTDALEVIDVIL